MEDVREMAIFLGKPLHPLQTLQPSQPLQPSHDVREMAIFLGIKVIGPPPLFCDNKSACLLSDNNTSSKRMKHIATRIAFLRELIGEKRLNMYHISTHGQFADIFTKPLAADTFHRFRRAVLVG